MDEIQACILEIPCECGCEARAHDKIFDSSTELLIGYSFCYDCDKCNKFKPAVGNANIKEVKKC